jgi:hypothetical protein
MHAHQRHDEMHHGGQLSQDPRRRQICFISCDRSMATGMTFRINHMCIIVLLMSVSHPASPSRASRLASVVVNRFSAAVKIDHRSNLYHQSMKISAVQRIGLPIIHGKRVFAHPCSSVFIWRAEGLDCLGHSRLPSCLLSRFLEPLQDFLSMPFPFDSARNRPWRLARTKVFAKSRS